MDDAAFSNGELLAREFLVGFKVLGTCALDHLGRQMRAWRGLVPVQGFEVVAQVLLVVGRRRDPFTIAFGRPEARRIGREGLVDEV